MIEPGRRHGYYDPRYGLAAAVRRKSHLRLVPDADAVGDEGIEAWEDDGGLATASPRAAVEPYLGVDWEDFFGTFFPGRRRHDFEAVKAYESYRETGVVPAGAAPERTPAIA